MSFLLDPPRWCRRLVVCLLVLGTGVFAMSVATAKPPRAPQNKKQQQKLEEQAAQLNQQVGRLFRSGKYREALPLAQRVATLRKQVLGEQHPSYARSLTNLAGCYLEIGDYAKAEPLFQKSLALCKQVLGEKHADYAQSLNNLAMLYQRMGAYAKAEPLFQRALALRKELLGEKHPAYARSLNNLAVLYAKMGDYAKAEPLYQQALTVREKSLGNKHPEYAGSLNNLASLYVDMGAYAKAEPLYQQALALHKQVLGEKHPSYITSLNNLAALYHEMRDYAKAEPLYQQALRLYKEVGGEKSNGYAIGLNNLAELYRKMGDYSKAEPFYQQALRLSKERLGDKHPEYAIPLYNLAMLYLANKEARKGEPLARQAAEITRALLEQTATVQSERQQFAMMANSRRFLDGYLSLAAAAGSPAEEIYTAVLAWKGAVSARQQQVRLQRQRDQRPEVRKLFAELQQATTRLAQMPHSRPDSKQPGRIDHDFERVNEEIEQLQRELARLSEPYRQQLLQQRMSPAELRKALPKGTALVDLLEYDSSQMAAKGQKKLFYQRRLMAFVLRSDRPVVRLDLGPVLILRHNVSRWRRQLGLGKAGMAAGRQLRQSIWRPLEIHLGGVSTVLISPDGLFSKFPWGALPGRKADTYLLEERAIAILPIPQQLPQMLRRPPQSSGEGASLLLVGDVDYGADPGRPGTAVAARSAPRSDRAGTRGTWSSLHETGQEILAVRASFEKRYAAGKATTLRKEEATEETVCRQAPHHRYLHFATHGFFASEQMRSGLTPALRDTDKEAAALRWQPNVSGVDPGLLSGLVLAGANRAGSAQGDDGILTALEVGALDLSSAELAVLSACETGLGAEAGGEGLLGLQRAFQVAGTRSVVAGLWTVDDRATRALMVDFYDNLWSKKLPRVEALRQAQLNMLREGIKRGGIKRGLDIAPDEPSDQQRRLPPFYWAAFVLSGDWR